MLTIPWSLTGGWEAPKIQPCKRRNVTALCESYYRLPDGPLSLEPSSTVLHYAQTLFEGMKAYRDANGKVTLFRPDMNMKRMLTSAQRLALPASAIVQTCFINFNYLPLFRHLTEKLY